MLLVLLPQGLIISLQGEKGVIKSENHGELPFEIQENLSDVDFTAEDVNEEVEFTVLDVSSSSFDIFFLINSFFVPYLTSLLLLFNVSYQMLKWPSGSRE